MHLLDEATAEVPVLEEDPVAVRVEHPGDPGRPLAVGLVEADEEVALAVRGVSHPGRRYVRAIVHRRRHLTRIGASGNNDRLRVRQEVPEAWAAMAGCPIRDQK